MAQLLVAVPIPEAAEPGKESYEMIWDIPDWREVRKSEGLVNRQVAVFETTSSDGWFKTKWIVGLTVVPFYKIWKCVQLYWKLLEITGSQAEKLDAKLQTQLWNFYRAMPLCTDENNLEIQLTEMVETKSKLLEFNPFIPSNGSNIIGHCGKITYKLKLTLTTPPLSSSVFTEKFFKKSVDQARQNHVLLVNNSESADLKFVTSDRVEIWAHQAILKAQCPVFAAMFNSNFSEKSTGIIQMTDITAKTLKILLRYFYTGELDPSWKDSDTIMEFTYAAGKYQMTEVLELLDFMLGGYSVDEASNLDVKLINLAGKLKLENAEAKLLKRIVTKIGKVKASGEIFKLFVVDEQELSDLVEVMANDVDGESSFLAAIAGLDGDDANEAEISLENGMAMLAHVQKKKLKRLEENLLKCFAEKAKLVQNADELFELFGRGTTNR